MAFVNEHGFYSHAVINKNPRRREITFTEWVLYIPHHNCVRLWLSCLLLWMRRPRLTRLNNLATRLGWGGAGTQTESEGPADLYPLYVRRLSAGVLGWALWPPVGSGQPEILSSRQALAPSGQICK